MIKIFQDTKIYVPCPAGSVTGGAELLHQLVSYLNEHGRDAYIVYFETIHSADKRVPSDYSQYKIKVADEVENASHNIEVIYEGIYDTIYDHPDTQKVLWWLSVDNFYLCSQSFLSPFDYIEFDRKRGLKLLYKTLKHLLLLRNEFKEKISIKELSTLKAVNAYQSEYAQAFLLAHNFPNVVPLKDYINIDHCKAFSKNRDDIVLYNPKKGLEFTQRLISAAPDIQWVPLQGMSRKELIEVIKKAKVYIDFGYHPGKDRLPRECAMNGCCVITGKRGSAAFFEDVSVIDKYKFDERTANIDDIISTIRWTLNNYETTIDDFQYYRASIAYEKEEFEAQIRRLFDIKL